MRTAQLVKRGLGYYWRTNVAGVLGVATAVSVLAGALLVGDSVRGSLKDLVVQRLGQASFVISSNNFFREQLANDLANDPRFRAGGLTGVCPLISLEGTVTHERSKRVGSGIKVYGVDERFWRFNLRPPATAPQNRNILISPSLAQELGATAGDSILVQVQKPSEIPLESLHSKKEDLGKTLRLTAGGILDGDTLGEFSIQPQQGGVRAIFVSLNLLQREIEQVNKINLLLVSDVAGVSANTSRDLLNTILRERVTLEDLGIRLRSINLEDQVAISLEPESEMVDDVLARIAGETGDSLALRHTAVFSYLANDISDRDRSVPYSLVTALDESDFAQLTRSAGHADATWSSSLPPIILNEWAAQDLGAHQGDQIKLDYYLWQEGGHLDTRAATFQLAGVVPIRGIAADQNLVPEYPGITGSENLSDWDPPFPIDLQRIRQKDEDYWHKYRTTPKAFIPLRTGQALWQNRFGKLTSMRFWPSADRADESRRLLEEKLRAAINPTLMGVTVVPVRSEGLQASQGATDFGEYFLYFSFFLVISALLLTALFFKLGIEQRIREIGVLRAVGFGPSRIRTMFLIEGMVLAIAGSILGLLGAIVYGRLMMLGLSTWWVGAVGTTALNLHVSTQSLLIGAFGGIVVALICVALTLRGLKKQSTRSLLAGVIWSGVNFSTTSPVSSRRITSLRVALVLTACGVLLLLAATAHLIGQVAGFFGGGFVLLAAFLLYQASWLRRKPGKTLQGSGWWPLARLGFRNTTFRPGRSVLCIALIAFASFIIVAVDSFRHRDGDGEALERNSGTGGFPLLAESLVPLVKDPNSREGQEALGLFSDNVSSPLSGVTFTRFRVQPGDDASCLNLYQPRNPKIIAPTEEFLRTNRFVFQSAIDSSAEEVANPWLLLHRQFSDGAIPVIADGNSLTYVLHLKPGEDLTVQHGAHPVRMRVVAALADSIFQSELLMSEQNFLQAFPDREGYRFFLIDLPVERAAAVTATLEDRLADYGFDAQSTAERLASFHRVENTYLSTFQMLGGLGLVLGTIGLSAVLLRNVLERRRELALMRAVGYNRKHFTVMIVAENLLLLLGGLITGTACALLAITPVLFARHGQPANVSLGLLLLAVLVSGLIASIVATWAALRAPLLSSLRAE